jgi:hypothetical protein
MARGEGQAQLSLEGTGGIFSGRISLGALTQNYRGNSVKLMREGSYGSVRLGDALVYAGYLDHWWGPGQISALSVSNNARPLPQVGIERAQTTVSSWPVLRAGTLAVRVFPGLPGRSAYPAGHLLQRRTTDHPSLIRS